MMNNSIGISWNGWHVSKIILKGQKLSEKYIKTDNDLNKKYFHLLVSVEFL